MELTNNHVNIPLTAAPRKKVRTDRERRELQAKHTARVLKLLKTVLSGSILDAPAIAKKLRVTERTINRDLRAIKKAGVPLYFDPAVGGYRVPHGYQFHDHYE